MSKRSPEWHRPGVGRWLFALMLAAPLAGCGDRSTPVRFENDSGLTLEHVQLAGRGFEAHLGTVGPGDVFTAKVYPRGESGMQVSFEASGKAIMLAPQGYLEGGGAYSASLRITPDLEAEIKADVSVF